VTITRDRRARAEAGSVDRPPAPAAPARFWPRRALLGVLLAGAVFASVLVALHSPLLEMRHVTIDGGPHESRAMVLAAGDLLGHPPLIDVATARAASGIEGLPWVAAATVSRNWPMGISVVITERTPIGTVLLASGRIALLDRTGRVLGVVPSPPRGLVTLTGLGAVPAAGGTVSAVGRAVVQVAAGVPLRLEHRIASFGADGEGVVARLVHGATVVFGGPGDLEEKYVALATLEADEPAAVASAKAIDLRVAEAPVLTP